MATPKDLPRDVGGFIRDLRQSARISLRQLAEQTGVSNPYLSQIERGLRKPSAEVLQQLASALRVSTPAMYLRAGLLDSDGQQGVLAAIAVDADLTIAQKQSLSQIYETFRGENARNAPPADVPAAEPPADVSTLAPADMPTDVTVVPVDETSVVPVDETPVVPVDEAARQSEAVVESIAVLDSGATPAPRTTKPAKKATRRAATKAAPTAEEEKS